MNIHKFGTQSDNIQFVSTFDAEEYSLFRKFPICQICNKEIANIRMILGTKNDVIRENNLYLLLVIYDFQCHGSILRFKTHSGQVSKVEELI